MWTRGLGELYIWPPGCTDDEVAPLYIGPDHIEGTVLKSKRDMGQQDITVSAIRAALVGLEGHGDANDQLIYKEYRISTEIPTSNSEGICHSLVRNKCDNEGQALYELNIRDCKFVPTLLGTYHHIDKTSLVKTDGLIMTRVPGLTLGDCYNRMCPEEQAMVKQAFAVALEAVNAHRIDNGSHHLGNILWNREEHKCYIVDFERACWGEEIEYESPEKWGLY
ncbi:hypothetical protein LTR27_012424 [Elasticomyces elasticus]|nr:hypothetical protein LTR27_012424 [Elasticomyces elasticus]